MRGQSLELGGYSLARRFAPTSKGYINYDRAVAFVLVEWLPARKASKAALDRKVENDAVARRLNDKYGVKYVSGHEDGLWVSIGPLGESRVRELVEWWERHKDEEQ
jgi:hypothetical protein